MRNKIAAAAGVALAVAIALATLASGVSAARGDPTGRGPGQGPMMGSGQGPMHGGMMGSRQAGPAGLRAGYEMDRHFVEEMIPHHEDAIAMADLALAQAEHLEIRGLAEAIKVTQAAEIEQMRQWYREWYGMEVPPSAMADRMRAMHGEPTDIDGSRPFDKAFIVEMVPHHQMAVMMSSHMYGAVQHPELRALMESIATSQAAEIEQMRQWHRAWYGGEVAPFGPGANGGPGRGARWG